jgi:hypothetical protein
MALDSLSPTLDKLSFCGMEFQFKGVHNITIKNNIVSLFQDGSIYSDSPSDPYDILVINNIYICDLIYSLNR